VGGVLGDARSLTFGVLTWGDAEARPVLLSTGKAVELADLEVWLRFYFGLELRK
jgi:hypothetical protein